MITTGQCAETRIRVLIVDDHPVVRDGIASLLECQDDMLPVGEAGDGAEAVALFKTLRPDVTLMDVQMPVMGGVEAIEAIRRASADAIILVLTTFAGDARVGRAIRAGAAGYLLKNCLRTELADTIRAVHGGRHVLSPAVAHDLALHALDDRLTERELGILRLIAQGHANKTIAWKLDLSIDTVKAHLKSIFQKLGVADRTRAVVVAMQRGYIDS